VPHARIASINPGTPEIRIISFMWLGLSCIMVDALLSFSPKPNADDRQALSYRSGYSVPHTIQ
jgi:hypothetical protein